MDPFNERANDSFFDALPKHYAKTKDSLEMESLYGSPASCSMNRKTRCTTPKRSAFSSKEKGNSRSGRSEEYSKDFVEPRKNTSDRSGRTADTERSSSPETPPQNSRVGYDRATLARKELSGWKSRDIFGGDSSSQKSRTSGTDSKQRTHFDSITQKKQQGRDIFPRKNKTSYLKEEEVEYEDDLQDAYMLPPAFQVIGKSKPKKSSGMSSSRRGTRDTASTQRSSVVQDVQGSMTKKAVERARSKERRQNSDESLGATKRERSLSVGRLRKRKEEKREEKRYPQEEESETFSNSLPSMGYQGLREERSKSRHRRRDERKDEDDSTLQASSPHRLRSSSIGRLSNKTRNLRENIDEKQNELSSSRHSTGYNAKKSRGKERKSEDNEHDLSSPRHTVSSNRRKHRMRDSDTADREERPRRSNSVGRLREQKASLRDQQVDIVDCKPRRSNSIGRLKQQMTERQEVQTDEQDEKPRRSSSQGPLNRTRQGSVRREGEDSARSEKRDRSNSLGPLHKKRAESGRGKSQCEPKIERQKRSTSLGPLRKKREELKSREENHENKVPSMFEGSRVSKTKARTMDDIFGSAEEVLRAKKEKQAPTAINAVQGNKSALAAWKMRESFKCSPRKSVRPVGTNQNGGQHHAVPSLFQSPKSCRKDKTREKINLNGDGSRRASRSIDLGKYGAENAIVERRSVQERIAKYNR
jgi:hypothetical protein